MFCLDDDIYKPKPNPWRVWETAKGLNLKLFHEQVGNEVTDRGALGSTMYLFIILTLEEKATNVLLPVMVLQHYTLSLSCKVTFISESEHHIESKL